MIIHNNLEHMDQYVPKLLGFSAWRAAFGYLVFGIVWIGGTDWLALQLAADQSELAQLQSVKGWIFVGLSTIFIYVLLYFRERQVDFATERLTVAMEQLQVIHRVFRHNLRNELTVFRGYVESTIARLESEPLKRQLELASRSANRMDELNEALQKIENAHNPTEEIIEIIPMVRSEAAAVDNARIRLETSHIDEAYAMGDSSLKLLFREILAYLLEKQPDGADTKSVEIEANQSDRYINLNFRSRGVRIPDSELEPIRVGREEDLFHATGVDLWVIKWLANYYGAKIEIETEDDETVIELQFPELPQVDQLAISAKKQIDQMVRTANTGSR